MKKENVKLFVICSDNRLLKKVLFSLRTKDFSAEIEIRHNRLQQNASHYDVLKVDSNASQDQITAAYDQISLMLHPDKLHHISSKETKAFALEIYVRACDAYSSLKNSSFRRSYDLALQKGMSHKEASSAQSQTFRPKTLDDLSTHSVAKRSLRKAQRALASRQFDMVLLHVKFALEMDPENELLREKWEDLKTKYS